MSYALTHQGSGPPQALGSSAANGSLPRSGDGPHAKRGWLKNGNPPGDLSQVARCGAKTRRGAPCRAPAMANGRCRMHGGCSTGPRTPEGLERCRRANWKHGRYSASAKAERKALRAQRRWLRQCTGMLGWVDKLWALLFEIADALGGGESKGLESKCRRALRMWNEFEEILAGCPGVADGSARRTSKSERSASVLRTLLELGAAGAGAEDLARWLEEAAAPKAARSLCLPLSASGY